MQRFCLRVALVSLALSVLLCDGLQQHRYASGPYKGFVQEDPVLNKERIEEPFRVRTVSGKLRYASGPLPGAFFEVRDSAGKVYSSKSNLKGDFVIAQLRSGAYIFKATKDGFQSVVGAVIVSDDARQGRIELYLKAGG